MVPQTSLPVALVDVAEVIPSPSGWHAGRARVDLERLIVKALTIRLVRNVSTTSGLMAVFPRPTAMRCMHGAIGHQKHPDANLIPRSALGNVAGRTRPCGHG